MSRVTKWRFEKTKVKVVFRLQFHATNIPLSGWDKLFISFIPSDSGKATAKTTKANVRNGTCKWADPIYETTRLLQDSKTKQYEEKIYKLVIAMGSSRSSILGEATINLADYSDASKPSVVSLPLYGCDSGTTLHVTVQLLTSKTGFREFEQQRELRERGLQTDQNNPDEFSSGRVLLSEDATHDQMDKVLSRVKFKDKFKDLAPLEEEEGPNEEYTESAIGFDGSSNTSESQYAEKHDTSSAHEIDSLKCTTSGDLALYAVSQGPQQDKGDPSDPSLPVHGINDWVHSWSSDYPADNDLAAAYEENCRLRGSLEVAESSIIELKLDLSSLQNYADQIGLEAQKFDRQLAAEISFGEELAKEVSVLKSESLKLKADLKRLEVSKSCFPFSCRVASVVEQDHMLKDLQLRWFKGLSVLEEKIRDFQNKACLGCHERDFRFLQSDLEAILAFLQNLKQGTELVTSSLSMAPSEGSTLKESTEMSLHKNRQFVTGTGFDLDMYQPDLGMLHCLSIPGLVSHGPDSEDSTNALKGKIFELLRELDESKTEKESLAKKMDHMECYYEALVQELEENQRQMLGELQNLKNEHSTCLYVVSSTKAEKETICQGLNEQMLRLTEDKCNLISFNEELERRAIAAEAALKRTRLNYSIAVDHLQKDLELLSSQLLSMFETSENLVRQAFADSSQPNFEGQLERERMLKFDSGGHPAKLSQFQNQFTGFKKQQLGGDIFLDDLKKSLHMQEGLYRKVDEEVSEVLFVNVYLDVLSKTLQETLLQAHDNIKIMNKKISELLEQLELSSKSKESLVQKLQMAEDDIRFLNECNATCIAKCNDMSQQNQKLEANVQDLTNENFLLMQKVTEWESLVLQCSHYESRYETCMEEKTELAYLLENKTLENGDLQNEIFMLQEELKVVRTDYDVLSSTEKNLQNFVNFLQNKLQSLLAQYDISIKGMLTSDESGLLDVEHLELTDILITLEQLQHGTSQRILQLMEEKEGVLHEKDIVLRSLSVAESEIALMKQKFEFEIRNMVEKLDLSNALVQKLHKDMEAVMSRLQLSFEVEEKHEQLCNELFSDLEHLEVELHELTSSNNGIACELLVLETLMNELGKSNLIAVEPMKENQTFIESLQDKNEEVTKLALELKTLKESLLSLQDENQALIRSSQDKEGESAQLASELNSLKVSLQSLHHENQALTASFQSKFEEAAKLASELYHSKESLQFVHDENQMLLVSLQAKAEESTKLVLELDGLKESLQSLHDENQMLMASSHCKVESAKIASELHRLKESLQSLQEEKHALILSSENKTNEAAELALELNNLKESLQRLHDENQSLSVCSHDKSEESAKLVSELNSLREYLQSQQDENQALVVYSQSKTEETEQITLELNSLKDKFESLNDEFQEEKRLKEMLEHKIRELTSELGEKESQLLQLQHCESELFHLKQFVLDLESEKSKLFHLLLQTEECLKNAYEESASIPGLQTQLFEMHELLVAADVKLVFIKAQYEGRLVELVKELYSSDRLLVELHKKQIDVELVLNQCLATEAQYMQENAQLLTHIDSLNSELEASIAENRLLREAIRVARAEFEEYKGRAQIVECNCGDKYQDSSEVQRLKLKLVTSEEEVVDLMVSKQHLEVHMLVLKAKLKEQKEQIVLLEGCHDDLVASRQQCDELTEKLSDQMLKTEEFRHLSLHLKELKEKADAECIQAREKRELEGPPFAVQESLRIAFIKEQHETKLQELKQQLSVSKRHSEEMLWKLQDALNEIESRKKSEASLLKKNQELGMNLLELEAELQSALFDKREKVKAYDLMKAEMECSLISLECCKEEKQKLETLLKESFEEKSRIEAELTLMKEQLGKVKPALMSTENAKDGFCEEEGTLADDSVCRIINQTSLTGDTLSPESKSVDTVSLIGLSWDMCPGYLEQDTSANFGEAENECQPTEDKLDVSMTLTNYPFDQVGLASFGENGLHGPTLPNEQKLLNGDTKHLALINDQFRAEGLKSSMDHLSNELERMKNENSIVQHDDEDFDQKFPYLQTQLVRLRQANEELGSMFPLFNEFSRSGNALERVLALEIELAEALQSKKRSSVHFQSSFLKQHSDEEAIFTSFRDINELIKDMLEMKGRYTAMESELKDMHDRYSQLSLQFVEVDGERQKLMMTLKNVRTSKRSSLLNRFSSPSLGENC